MTRVHVTLTNETKGYQFSEYIEDVEDDCTDGQLFRMMQREYGRCTSKIYVDPDARSVGWYFEKLQRYEDTNEPYMQGAWCFLEREVMRGSWAA